MFYSHGLSALQCAVSNGNSEIINLLLQAGCHVNAVGAHGRTALYSAAENGRLDVLQILIDGGAKINVQDDYGEMGLFVCLLGFNITLTSEVILRCCLLVAVIL